MLEGDMHTIDELIARYDLEPDLKDLFVEGRRDLIFYRDILDKTKYKNVIVYQISDKVIITDDLKEKAKKRGLLLSKNNRNKVIFLAQELEPKINNKNTIRCVADSDFNIILKKRNKCSILLFTDYANLEMYLFNFETIRKYFNNFLRRIFCPIKKIIVGFEKTLTRLFLIRLVNEILDYNLTWLEFSKYWSCNNFEINFDENIYINAFLSKNSQLKNKSTFLKAIKKLEKCITSDPRNQIHGHDFIELLRLYSKRCLNKKQKFCDKEIVEGALFCSYDSLEVKKENLFKLLLDWAEN